MDVICHLLPPSETNESILNGRNQVMWFPEKEISMESFVVGALEATFHEMVTQLQTDFNPSSLPFSFAKPSSG